jgi:flagellar basal body-associated protein FliL
MLEHELLALNVSAYTEKKQGLTYLSWAHAWAQALQMDPEANFHVHAFDGKAYMDVNGTGMVWVDVTMGGRTRTCWLPVMDHRNKPIQNPDAFQVNTAIMRCLTKCLAMFGLGLNVYAGEDLPLVDDEAPKKEENKEEKKEKSKPSAQEKENLTLFADTLLQYLEIQRTEKDLISYWKSNQTTLDAVKEKMPDLFDIIRTKFGEAKAEAKRRADGQA